MVDTLTDPVFVGVAASVVFGLIKRFTLVELARDEVRFIMAVLLAGVAGALVAEDPAITARLWAGVASAASAVTAYNGWKHLVLGMIDRWFDGELSSADPP
jgi:hypothetical protein